MGNLLCSKCDTEMETVAIQQSLPDGETFLRERTYCPACGLPDGASVTPVAR